MESRVDDGKVCCCDPLKGIIQKFLQTRVSALENDGDRQKLGTKLHLFYKSSVLRFPVARGRKLQCRISEEMLKGLAEWLTAEEGKNLKINAGAENFNIGQVISVIEDKFGNVSLELDVNEMKGNVVKWIVTEGWLGYSKNPCHNQLYRVEIAMTRVTSTSIDSSFLEYRKILAAQATSTIMKKLGHCIDDVHFTCLSVPSFELSNCKIQPSTVLVAGTPIEAGKSEKSCPDQGPETVLCVNVGDVTANPSGVQDMLSKRLAEIKEISESRRLESLLLSSWATSLDNLTRATLHYDILYRPLETSIQLGSLSESGQMNNNALFIMYNYSRILSILRKFGEQVESGEYPQLPDIHEVDFTRLCEREEELQLLQLMMEWPRLMESSVNFVRYQLNLVIISKFLLALAKAFNSFYFQIVVLVPTNASHNFPAMMARVYFIKAICKVFEDCLDILQVNHANSASPQQP